MISKTICVHIIGSCLLAVSLFTVSHVQAADLGGDCCADLEERVADLEATTARKGNRKVSLKISGWVSRTLGWSSLPPEIAQLTNALNGLSDPFELAKALNRLAPKAQYAHVNNALQSSASFANSLLSCGVRDGDHVFSLEGQCSWSRLSFNRLDRDVTSELTGLDKTGVSVSAGFQKKLVDEWRLGFAASYENSTSRQSDTLQDLDKITGDALSLGAVVKNRWGPLSGSVSLFGSYGWYDSKRYVGLAGVGDVARSDQNVGSVSTQAKVSRLFGSSSFYLKPMVDLSATWLHLGSYSETGAAGANLSQKNASEWFLSATPAIEIGGEFAQRNGVLWRPYLRGGLSIYDKDKMQVTTRFTADPNDSGTAFDANFEKVYGEIEAGVNVLTTQGLDLKFSYEGRYGEHTRAHSGNLKLSVKF